jgi:hypothetical protein
MLEGKFGENCIIMQFLVTKKVRKRPKRRDAEALRKDEREEPRPT